MRFFRSAWLQRIMAGQMLLLISAAPLAFEGLQGDHQDGFVIHTGKFVDQISTSLRQIQIKYGFDAVHGSVVPVFNKILSGEYVPGTSFDPLSTDLLTNPYRAPPHHPSRTIRWA